MRRGPEPGTGNIRGRTATKTRREVSMNPDTLGMKGMMPARAADAAVENQIRRG